MIKNLSAILAAALLTGGLSSSLISQEQSEPAGGETEESAPRLTPDERRERWQEMRGNDQENRRERMREWREAREARGGEGEEATAEGPMPENYLDQLEFRGILTIDGVTQFTLRNPWEERTLVLTEDEGRSGVEVVEFDAENNALTVSHEGETRILHLQASRVSALEETRSEQDRRREMWEARRERFERFRATWEEAAENSPELREIESSFRDLAGDFRNIQMALREAEPGSPEHTRLQEQQGEMRQEFRLLSEYSLLEVQRNPAFAEEDEDVIRGMMRGMMQQGRGDGRGDGRRGRGGN